LIDAAERRANAAAEAELRHLIEAIDDEINALQAEIDAKLKQIVERLVKLEAGGVPEVSA